VSALLLFLQSAAVTTNAKVLAKQVTSANANKKPQSDSEDSDSDSSSSDGSCSMLHLLFILFYICYTLSKEFIV